MNNNQKERLKKVIRPLIKEVKKELMSSNSEMKSKKRLKEDLDSSEVIADLTKLLELTKKLQAKHSDFDDRIREELDTAIEAIEGAIEYAGYEY